MIVIKSTLEWFPWSASASTKSLMKTENEKGSLEFESAVKPTIQFNAKIEVFPEFLIHSVFHPNPLKLLLDK